MTVKERVLKMVEALSDDELRELEQYLQALEGKRDKASGASQDDFAALRQEWLMEKVAQAFKNDRGGAESLLATLGFEWVDDEDDTEEREEASAWPVNERQALLVRYFEGKTELSDEVLQAFLAEKASDHPNYPLVRRYFKRGNEALKRLLLLGLERDKTSLDLLSDLAFFHQFSDVRLDLLQRYLWALEAEQDVGRFSELVMDFFDDADDLDVNALHQLQHMFAAESEKGQLVRRLAENVKAGADEPGLF